MVDKGNNIVVEKATVKAVSQLQRLKRSMEIRVMLLEKQAESIKSVMMKDFEKLPAEVETVLDNVIGDLGNGYFVQNDELRQNSKEVEQIKQDLEETYSQIQQ